MSPLRILSDCREYRAGEKPGDMTARVGTGTTYGLQRYHIDDAEQGRISLLAPPVAETAYLTWDAIDGAADRADQELLVCIRPLTSGSAMRAVGIRLQDGTAGGYFVRLTTGAGGSAELERLSGTSLSLAAAGADVRQDRWIWIRTRAQGTAIKANVWVDGLAEPFGWLLSGTSSSHADGRVGLAVSLANQRMEVRFISVATGGATAPGEADLPRPLPLALLDPSAALEATAELEYAPIEGGTRSVLWVSSRHREANAGDYPANVSMPKYLVQAGRVVNRLDGDEVSKRVLYGGRAVGEPGQLVLREAKRLHWFLRRSFAGHRVTIRVGEAGSTHRGFAVVQTPTFLNEPQFDPAADVARFDLASGVAQALGQNLAVRTYAGLPTWLLMTAATATAPNHVAYDTTAFVVAGRFRIPPGSSGALPNHLARRQITSANQQIFVALSPGTSVSHPGEIEAFISSGGTQAMGLASGARYDDDLPHWWAVGVNGAAFAYLMVDGIVVDSAVPAGAPDIPATGFVTQTVFPMSVGDLRFYGRYLDPIQMRAEMAARAPDETATVGLWTFEDGTGTVATDFSSTANNMALTGTYTWAQSRLGDEARAGENEPIIAGLVYNAEADRDDAARKSYRYSDGAPAAGTLAVRARGKLIATPADYTTTGEGSLDTVAVQAPPVTVDLGPPPSGADPVGIHVPRVAKDLLIARSALADRLEPDSWDGLRTLAPFRGGAWWKGPPQTAAALDELLGGMGAHFAEDSSGRLGAGFLLPPVTPGPYGMHSVLEFLGLPGGRVTFPAADFADGGGSCTVACWFKTFRDIADPAASASYTFVPEHCQTLAAKLDLSYTKGYFLGLSSLNPGQLIWGHPGAASTTTGLHFLRSPPGAIRAGYWYLALARFDPSTNTRSLLLARLGDPTLRVAATEFCTAPWAAAAGEDLVIGGSAKGELLGSVCHLAYYSKVVSDFEGNAWLEAPAWVGQTSPSSLSFYAPLTEGFGSVVRDLDIGAHVGRMVGARWAPRARFDLGARVRPRISSPRNLKPASRITVAYRKNYRPLAQADLVGTVTPAEAADVASPFRFWPWISPEVTDATPGAREIDIESRLSRSIEAAALSALLATRSVPGLMACELLEVGREGLALRLTDEIHLTHPGYYLDAGAAFRIVARDQDPVTHLGSLGLMGGSSPSSPFLGAGADLFLGAGRGERFGG